MFCHFWQLLYRCHSIFFVLCIIGFSFDKLTSGEKSQRQVRRFCTPKNLGLLKIWLPALLFFVTQKGIWAETTEVLRPEMLSSGCVYTIGTTMWSQLLWYLVEQCYSQSVTPGQSIIPESMVSPAKMHLWWYRNDPPWSHISFVSVLPSLSWLLIWEFLVRMAGVVLHLWWFQIHLRASQYQHSVAVAHPHQRRI